MPTEYTIEIEGLTLEVVRDNKDEGYAPMMGGDDRNPTWEQYVGEYKPEFRPHIELIKEAIINMGWVGRTGSEISNYYTFKFSDGEHWGFSWRAWGDLMQAIVDKQEGYMAYYM